MGFFAKRRGWAILLAVVSASCLVVFLAAPATHAAPITGSSGPGGFLLTGPTSSLTLWVKGDVGITEDGSDRVSRWADQSGRGNDLIQQTDNNKPLQNVTINNVPAIAFDGDGGANADHLVFTKTVAAQSIFFVSRTIDLGIPTGENPDAIFGGGTSSALVGYHSPSIRRHNTTKYRGNTDVDGYDFTYPTGSEFRVNAVLNDVVADGVTHIASAVRSTGTANWNQNLAAIAVHNNRAWHGVMGEVAMFNRTLNTAERLLVENYLSSKYNLGNTTVGPDNTLGASDFYAGDTAANGDYDMNVFGIGRLDATNQVTTAGQAGFGIEAVGGTLGDGEWVLAGHNVTTNSLTTNDLPAGIYGRWDRVWYVDENLLGGVDVTLAFDFSDAGLSPPIGNSFKLLYSQTDPFSFTDLGLTPIAAGDLVTFSVSDALLRNGYYTLGLVPEPSTLVMLLGLGGLGLLGWLRRRRRK